MKTNNKKVEDKFYGKRVVKGIFAKVNISSQINAAKQLGVQMARENKSSEYGDSRWNTLLNETYKMVGGENTDQGSNVGKQLREAWKSANEKEQGRIQKIQQDASFKLEATVRSLKSKLESKGFCSNNKNCSPQDKALQKEIGEAFSYETSDQQFISLIRKMTARLSQPFGAASKNSRTGVKAMFALNKAEAINEVKVLKLAISKLEPQLEMYKNRLKEAVKYYKSLVKGEVTFSRTGSKAKFSHLSTMLDMLDYQSANDQEDLAKKNIKALAQSIGKLNPTKDEWSRYVKIAKSLGFTESQISGFARTGSKAKFSMSVSYDPATELLTVGNKHYKCSRSQSGYVLNVLRNVRNAKNPSNEQARAIDEFQREGIISITDKTFNSKAKFGWPKSKFDIGDYVAVVGGSLNSVGIVSYTNYVDNKVDGGWKYKVIFPNGTMTFNEGSLKLAKPSSAAVSSIQARQ